ncbi:MAG TPA: 3-mercaptopyruvate sulfurtransferase [Alphaproteobacteria bacterium]|nr:3-mercaptopyruvate sulfurtransferase [Alphaproteobacteria bacterium]
MIEQLPPLVSTDWLAERLGRPDLKILDASWYMPAQARDAKAEYAAAHLPGAQFFDIDAVADASSGLPHMLPSPAEFGAAVGALGIGNEDDVVIYDGAGIFAAPRVWWTFRAFGHSRVAVLDGGLPKWKAENRPLETGPAKEPVAKNFRADPRPKLVRDAAAMRDNVNSQRELVLDARSEGRFKGIEPEPRAGLKGGHIPGSRNLPFQAVIDNGRMKSADELRGIFANAGVTAKQRVTASCGSGLTAAILAFGLYLTGRDDVAVYDGSWSEWGALDGAPIEK